MKWIYETFENIHVNLDYRFDQISNENGKIQVEKQEEVLRV